MPQQDVTLQYSYPTTQLDLDACRLAAAKVVTPGATNSHGVTILSVASTTSPAQSQAGTGSSQVICRVFT